MGDVYPSEICSSEVAIALDLFDRLPHKSLEQSLAGIILAPSDDHMQRSRRYKGQFPYNWDAMVAYQWHDTKAVKDNLTNDIDSVVLE